MEDVKVEQFLCLGNGRGYGAGYGYSNGRGFGCGDDCGNGYSDGSGDGFDDDDGCGYGYGYGCGSGDGPGNGFGNGSGYGYGDGYGYGNVNGKTIYKVDGVNTVFYSIHKNVAKGAIFNSDFTFTPCYIVKGNGYFAHGETIEKAIQSLESKIFQDLDVEEKIKKFIEEFELNKKYPAMKFYDWHNRLTGSCEMGRKAFARDRHIDLDKDEFMVEEFIKLTENSYGGEVIKQLKEKLGL